MKKIVANFKMNKTNNEVKEYIMKLLPKYEKEKTELVLCVPFTAITLSKFLLDGTNISIGAQNICDEDDGKSTGEISGTMIKSCGADYVIIGHSERRIKFKENGRIINKKIKLALKNRLKVILCVGETLAEKNTMKTNEVIKTQIEEALKGLYENELENIVIAYEPIWAIGTGKTPLAKEIENTVKVIKKVVAEDFSDKAGEKIEVLYGGSVDVKNSANFSKIKNINGMLIGGASLDADNFAQLIKNIS